MHFFDIIKHLWCAGISPQSQVGVKGGFFTQLLMKAFVCVPVTFTVVEGCLREEISEVHRNIACSDVVIILVSDFLKACLALNRA